MSQFASPSIRVFNSENLGSVTQRKLGSNNLQTTRKPFVDKRVNCNTPTSVQKKQMFNLPRKETAAEKSPVRSSENVEIDAEDYFSYKNVNDSGFEDLLPFSERLDEHAIYTVLKSFKTCTPPPSPHSLDEGFNFEEIPEPEEQFDYFSDECIIGKLENMNRIDFESIGEVGLDF